MQLAEEEDEFLIRRLSEERQKMAESSCLVRSAHEDLAELYEERQRATAAEIEILQKLLGDLNKE